MRQILLATSAAALVLTFAGQALAESPDTQAGASSTLPVTTAGKPNDPTQPAAQADKPADAVQQAVEPPQQATEQSTQASEQAKPADAAMQEAKPADAAPPAAETKPATAAAPDAQSPADAQAASNVPAKPALSAEDAAIAERLKDLVENKLQQFVSKEQERAGVQAFYRSRDYAPLWTSAGKVAQRERDAAAFLGAVEADGLDPSDYPVPAFSSTDPAKLAADELAMTDAVLTFVRHASVGRVAFSRVSAAIYFNRKAPDSAEVLGKLADASDVRATLDSFNPQAPAYKALKAELAAVRSGRAIEPDDAAVKGRRGHARSHEAKAHAPKIDTIIANMERWRWMPHDLGAAYVMVNIPDYTLKLVQNGKTVWSTKIVVGKPGTHATPLMTETMKYITVNPTWNVPPSIIRNEYLPVLAQDPDALARVGLRISHNADGSIRIYQPPGERNALGRLRFNFPNRFLVYQHDTPDKYLFAKATRAYSHGCMRVQNPDVYAEMLLKVSQPEDGYTAARIRSMYGSHERNITFKNPIPVYLSYQTVFFDDAGKLQTRADIYGLDKTITAILDGNRRVADVPVARNYNSSSKPVRAAANLRRNREPGPPGWGGGFGPFQSYDNGGYQSAYQAPRPFRWW